MSFTALTTKYFGKKVFGYTVGSLFSYIKWILISSIVLFVLYKGYDVYNSYNKLTKVVAEQQLTIKSLKETVAGLEDANKNLKKMNDLQEESGKTSSEAVGDLAKKNQKVTETFDKIKSNVSKDVTAVKTNPTKRIKKPDSKVLTEVPLTEGEITEAVSNIRITAIWRSYCSSNKPDETSAQSCKDVIL